METLFAAVDITTAVTNITTVMVGGVGVFLLFKGFGWLKRTIKGL